VINSQRQQEIRFCNTWFFKRTLGNQDKRLWQKREQKNIHGLTNMVVTGDVSKHYFEGIMRTEACMEWSYVRRTWGGNKMKRERI
jgi:hypothetical protein